MPDTRQPSRGIVFALAHVTIELSTPLTIGTGNGDDLNDSTCVLDTNGLPTIPGTSLAGMLRELGVPNPELRARLLSMMLDGLYVHAVVDPDSFRDPGFVEELKAEMARVLGCRT